MSLKDNATGVQHIGIPTNDIEETIAFYHKLGFETLLRTDATGEKVAFLGLKNLVVETYQNGEAVGHPGAIDHIAIDVADIEAAYAEVTGMGYEAIQGSVQFLPFWERGVKFFTIYGPNQEKVEFSQKL